MLSRCGLIAWRRRQQCEVGVFFVVKKDGNLRLILDCRPVNQCCKEAPYSNLSTPAGLTNVNLSDEWIQKCEGLSSTQFVRDTSFDAEVEVNGAGVDLKDGFYQFLAPTVSSWFGLGEQYTASEAGVTEVYNEDTGKMDE
eukprot:2346196-Karenia_brevis.AAC.1